MALFATKESMASYPYENLSSALHFDTNDATKPANNAVQSKNMWKESDINPKLKFRNYENYELSKKIISLKLNA